MASGDDTKGPGGRRRQKRPVKPRTIDLEAERVEPDTGPAEARDESSQDQHEPGQDAETTEAAAGAEGPDDSSPAEDPVEAPSTASDQASTEEAPGEDATTAPSETDPSETDTEPQEIEGGPHEPEQRRGGPSIAALGLAGLVGGAFALALFVVLQTADLLPTGDVPGLRADLAAAEARLTALEQEEAPAVDPEAVATLADDLASLEAQIADLPGEPADLSDLEARVAALEETEPDAIPEDIAARLDDLEDRVSAMGSELEGVQPADVPTGIADRMEELEAGLDETRDAQEALEQRMADIAEAAEVSSAAERDIARAAAGAIAFSGLARAMDAGRPYAEELTALQPLIDDPSRIETLSAHAADGLPTTRQLATEFERIAPDILEAGEEADPEDGLLNRLGAGARSLVRVRPAGPVEGDDRAAIVSRVEAALAEGNLAEARAEWESLDETARDASRDWAQRLDIRHDAENELGALTAEMVAAVAETADSDG